MALCLLGKNALSYYKIDRWSEFSRESNNCTFMKVYICSCHKKRVSLFSFHHQSRLAIVRESRY